MKKNLLFPLLLVFISCSNEKTETSISEPQNKDFTIQNDSLEVQPEVAIETSSDKNDTLVDRWQIDDYAEKIHGEKIYSSWDEIPEIQTAGASFYEILDIKGGFAKITGAYEGAREFVMWRMEDGNDLVGVMSMGCGPACDYSFQFYICNQNQINEIELKDIMPISEMDTYKKKMHEKALKKFTFDYPEDISYIFNFPRKGTSMEVAIQIGADEMHIPTLQLSWDKKKFHIEKTYEEIQEKTYY